MKIIPKNRLLLIAAVVLVVIVLPAILFASEQAAVHHELPSLETLLATLLPYWVNFVIFAGALFFLLRNPIKQAWSGRKSGFQDYLSRAQETLRLSQDHLKEVEGRVSRIVEERRRVKLEIEHETEVEVNRILREAKNRAEAIARQAQETGVAEHAAAKRGVQREMIALAMEGARRKLEQQVTPEFDRTLRQAACCSAGELMH